MADFASNLKSVAGKTQHIWLADGQFGNGQTYQALAQPGVLAGVKQAGIGHVFVDLPKFVGFVNDALVDGRAKPEQLANDIAENPSYRIYANKAPVPAQPAEIAAVMQRAHAAGVHLHFTGESMLENFDGTHMQNTIEAQFVLHTVNNRQMRLSDIFSGMGGDAQRRQQFAEQQMKIKDSPIARIAADILDGHKKQLEGTVAEVKALPEGERALIIQHANPQIGMSVESLLGADKVGRIEASDLHKVAPSGNTPRLRDNGVQATP